MHDRRIDGVAHTFGNYGALYMNAMTWWDHETSSVWSQPWGRAIQGEYLGVELFLIPSELTTWSDWRAAHPDTLIMVNDLDRLISPLRQRFSPDFVVGLVLADQAKAYYFQDVALAGVINDSFGGYSIVVWADETSIHAYFRNVNGRTLTFETIDGQLKDRQTGSRWDFARGLSIEGPLSGTALQPVPNSSAYDWAWLDFFPDSEFYSP